jgi:hypothetical protein
MPVTLDRVEYAGEHAGVVVVQWAAPDGCPRWRVTLGDEQSGDFPDRQQAIDYATHLSAARHVPIWLVRGSVALRVTRELLAH